MVQYHSHYESLFAELGSISALVDKVFQDYKEMGNYDRLMPLHNILTKHPNGMEALDALIRHRDSEGFDMVVSPIAYVRGVSKAMRETMLKSLLDHADPEVGHSAVDALSNLRRQKEDRLE